MIISWVSDQSLSPEHMVWRDPRHTLDSTQMLDSSYGKEERTSKSTTSGRKSWFKAWRRYFTTRQFLVLDSGALTCPARIFIRGRRSLQLHSAFRPSPSNVLACCVCPCRFIPFPTPRHFCGRLDHAEARPRQRQRPLPTPSGY